MKKIALVNHRCGIEVTGGSELHCRLLAKQLQKEYEVEIITTCAIDDNTWANYYPEGEQVIDGITVKRFPVAKERDWTHYNLLEDMVNNPNAHIYEEEVQWIIDQGPYSPLLCEYLHRNYECYDAIIFMTYLYYTSAICLLGIPNALFLPTAHDETALYLKHYKRVFSDAKAMLYNTEEERELLESVFPSVKKLPSIVGVYGLDLPSLLDIDNEAQIDLPDEYILYAGRITQAKGCDELFDYFLRYKKRYQNKLKLVLIGKKDMNIPCSDDIIFKGFVSDSEKMQYMRRARAFVLSSHFESLSMVVLESLAVETPILVTSKCKVLEGHIKKSGAGYTYSDYTEFEDYLNEICYNSDLRVLYGKRGREYVEKNYSWSVVVDSIGRMIDEVGYVRKKDFPKLEEQHTFFNRKIKPRFGNNNIPIVFASDNNYAGVLSVAIQSVISYSSDDINYDIIVFSDGISEKNKQKLLYMIEGNGNISIRFIEVGAKLNEHVFQFTNTQLSRATFMRLFIPELLSEYDKIIYMDCDMVLRKDIAELYQVDVGDYLIGAVKDPHIIEVWKFRDNVERYLRDVINLKNPTEYFNAGLLLINVRNLKNEYTTDELFDLATSRKWMWEDQCVLNYIAAGRVLFLDYRWNLFWVDCPRVNQMMRTNCEYVRAFDNPYLIHYCSGAMPINRPEERFSYYWWEMARKTPFYELLVSRMCKINQPTNNNEIFIYQGSGVKSKFRGLIRNIKQFGLVYSFELLLVYFKSIFKAKKGSRSQYWKSQTVELRKKYNLPL